MASGVDLFFVIGSEMIETSILNAIASLWDKYWDKLGHEFTKIFAIKTNIEIDIDFILSM